MTTSHDVTTAAVPTSDKARFAQDLFAAAFEARRRRVGLSAKLASLLENDVTPLSYVLPCVRPLPKLTEEQRIALDTRMRVHLERELELESLVQKDNP